MAQSHESLADLFAEISGIFSELIQSYVPPARPEGLFEILLGAYSDAEKETLAQRISDLVASDGDRLRRVIGEHASGSKDYVEKHDWLYLQPEALLIADLSQRPRLLAATVERTDFDRLVISMIDELKP